MSGTGKRMRDNARDPRAPYRRPEVQSLTAQQVVEALGYASALYGSSAFAGGYGED